MTLNINSSQIPGLKFYDDSFITIFNYLFTIYFKVYSSAKTNRLDNWTQLRQAFLETAVEMECPNTQQCCLYGIEDTDLYTCYRCIDCSSWLHMCLECLRNKHSLPHLHMFEKWMVSKFTLILNTTRLEKNKY